jgi:hypothetical protein
VRVEFSEERLVSDAGLLTCATLAERLRLEELVNESLTRAWEAGAGPGDGPLVIDLDSFIGEVDGYEKEETGPDAPRTDISPAISRLRTFAAEERQESAERREIDVHGARAAPLPHIHPP